VNEPAEGVADGASADSGDGEIQAELSRDLGLVSALAIGVGTMIAAGIFTLSGLAVKEVGSAAIAAFLVAAVVATFTALTYCEFASIYPQSGEGYLYARKTFAPPLAYTVGWCLLLGYTSSCGFYIASLSSYFNEFVLPESFHHLQEQFPLLINLSGLIALGALTLLNIKGTKESGSFQIVVTVGKVILLTIFVGGGIMAFNGDTSALMVEKFSTDIPKIGSTAALVFITFFGFSAIAASAGEVQNPTKTIPRAIFISMGIVTVLYTLVVLVLVAAELDKQGLAYSEASMGVVAKQYLGGIGGMVIVAGALFSMISASNASIMAGSRVALSMSQLGHLPKEIGAVNANTRTPVVSLIMVGLGIGTFAVILPLESLAHFADCVLLLALILVNIALIAHRRKYPDIERPFRVPLVPLLPGLGILANIYLLAQLPIQGHVEILIMAVGAIVAGIFGYLAWKGAQVDEADLPGKPSRVALERSAGTDDGVFSVLVPLANPKSVNQLIDLAVAIAKPRGGKIVAIRVVVIPEQLAPTLEEAHVERERRILESARSRALDAGVPCSTLVRVGHNAARAIIETSRERDCELILLGWKGHTSTARRILGEVTDDIVRHARTDIMLVKHVEGFEGIPKRILLPSAGGEHAIHAQTYAASIAAASDDGSLTLCGVVGPEDVERAKSEELRLVAAKHDVEGVGAVDVKLIRHASVPVGIIKEAKDYDALVIGAAGQSFSSQIMFGSIPETIARRATVPVIVVKRYHALRALAGRVMTD
jgi:basic amino acid/polyamine antiporter, APA family